MKSLSVVGAAAIALASAFPAAASCTLANIAGTWSTYSVAQASNGALDWEGCTLTITNKGGFSTSNSQCVDSFGNKAPALGQFNLVNPAICNFGGTMSFPKFGVSITIRAMTLSLDHMTTSGIGGGAQFGGVFVFNMVKTK